MDDDDKPPESIKPVVANAHYAEAYGESFKESQRTGICIFCKEMMENKAEVVKYRAGGWWAKQNPFPPKGRTHQTPAEKALLLMPTRCIQDIHQLTPNDMLDVYKLFEFVCQQEKITGGVLAIRFGDPALSGRTLLHLHYQLIVPGTHEHQDDPTKTHGSVDPIPFWVG